MSSTNSRQAPALPPAIPQPVSGASTVYQNPRSTGVSIVDSNDSQIPPLVILKGIIAGTNVTITEGDNDITISSAGGTGGSSSGDTGPTGPQGPAGSAGDTGATGSPGSAGPQGVAGAQGDTGSVGPQGDTGAIGAAGDTGAQGSTGPAGSGGVTGINDLGDAYANLNSVGIGYKATAGSNALSFARTGPSTLSTNSIFIQPAVTASGGSSNIVIGKDSGNSITAATGCTIVGNAAGQSIATGAGHVIIGSCNVANNISEAVAIGNGATVSNNYGIAIGSAASSTIANALNLPTTLAQTTDGVTGLMPVVYDRATGQVAPIVLGTAGQVLTVQAGATGVAWATPAVGSSSWARCRGSSSVTGSTTPGTIVSTFNSTASSSDGVFTAGATGIIYNGIPSIDISYNISGYTENLPALTNTSIYLVKGTTSVGVNIPIITNSTVTGLYYPLSYTDTITISTGDVLSIRVLTNTDSNVSLANPTLTVIKLSEL